MREPIVINAETREITVPETERAFGVAGERKVEVKHIRIEGRTVDGTDLTQGFTWKVSCENAGKELCADLIDGIVADAGNIEFDWIVGAAPMAYKGTMHFAVCAVRVDAAGNILQEWHSKLGAGDVANGIEATVQNIGGQDLLAHIQSITAAAQQNAAAAQRDAAAAAKSAEDAATSEGNAAASAKKAQTLVDGMPSDYSQAMKDIGTLKNQMQRAYPDDSTIGENTWSSKHIIDMLCPPLKESGNNVQVYPVENYPLGVKVIWAPVQEGEGDPSPENIRPITGRDAVSVTRHRKNYVGDSHALKSGVYSGVSYTINDDKTITMSGTPTDNVLFSIISYDAGKRRKIYPGTYTISGGLTNAALVFVAYDGNKANSQMIVTKKLTTTGETATFTIDAMSYFGLYAYAYVGQSVDGVMKPQIELGSTATPYEPYTGSTTIISLPETVYGGEVDAVSGEGQKTWQLVAFTGNEKFYTHSTNAAMFYTNFPDVKSNYKSINSHHSSERDLLIGGIYLTKISASGVIIFSKAVVDEHGGNIDGLKAWLAAQYAAGTPVQVCYKLATPVPFTVTGAQPIPALAGVNTVLTDADSATVTGRADPIKRITDLEDAVASQT